MARRAELHAKTSQEGELTKENRKKISQECLVRTVPYGRERERALPLVHPEPRKPNLERVRKPESSEKECERTEHGEEIRK